MIRQAFQNFMSAWSIDIYAGWSIMDVVGLLVLLYVISVMINYFFFKAGGGQ